MFSTLKAIRAQHFAAVVDGWIKQRRKGVIGFLLHVIHARELIRTHHPLAGAGRIKVQIGHGVGAAPAGLVSALRPTSRTDGGRAERTRDRSRRTIIKMQLRIGLLVLVGLTIVLHALQVIYVSSSANEPVGRGR